MSEVTPATLIHRVIICFVLFNILLVISTNIINILESTLGFTADFEDPVLGAIASILNPIYVFLKKVVTDPFAVALLLALDVILLALAFKPRETGGWI